MDYTPKELRLLAGPEFNAILAKDPELQRLEAMKYDKTADSRCLLEILSLGSLHIGKIPVMPLTIAKWAFLWLLGSPFVLGGEVGMEEADLMLYILSCPDLREIPCAIHELPAEASGMSLVSALSDGELLAEIRNMIRIAFLPLEMMPQTGLPEGKPQYDGVWAANIAGLAARESGMNFEYCLHKMPLSAVCALFVSFRLREGSESEQIRRRMPKEITELISARIKVLSREFLVKNK